MVRLVAMPWWVASVLTFWLTGSEFLLNMLIPDLGVEKLLQCCESYLSSTDEDSWSLIKETLVRETTASPLL